MLYVATSLDMDKHGRCTQPQNTHHENSVCGKPWGVAAGNQTLLTSALPPWGVPKHDMGTAHTSLFQATATDVQWGDGRVTLATQYCHVLLMWYLALVES